VGETGSLMTRVVILRRWKGKLKWAESALSAAGYEISFANDASFDPSAGDLVLVQGNFNWFPRARRVLSRFRPLERPAVIVWHSEPLPFPRDSGFPNPRLTLREMAKIALRDRRATDVYTNFKRLSELHEKKILDLIVVTSRSRQAFLSEKGIPSRFIPLGFHEGMGQRLDRPRDIDVLFLGTLDDSRHRHAIRYLESRGISVEARGSWKSGETWGEQRTELINRARIFLNIQRHAGQYSGYRMLLGMGNGAMVLSEPVHDPFPYEPGVHYVSTSLETMPETIVKYLSDEEARSAITEAGYRFATRSLTMESSMREIIASMEELLRLRGVQ
jgi:hypothetical protein